MAKKRAENELKRNHVYQGHVLDVLRQWPDQCVSMSMSSPPYWSLRDYGIEPVVWDEGEPCAHEYEGVKARRPATPGDVPSKNSIITDKYKDNYDTALRPSRGSAFCKRCGAWKGSLGLEPTPELFIKHLCDVYDEIKRVTVDWGTAWINLGDTYGGSGGSHKEYHNITNPGIQHERSLKVGCQETYSYKGTPPKCLVMIPQRFALEMINRGWILRNVIIWHKNNCMPSSATDRFTIDFEYLYFFSKQPRYYFEQQFEPHQSPLKSKRTHGHKYDDINNKRAERSTERGEGNPLGRNKRAVWNINTRSYKEAHFATYPPELCKTPIKAGCPKYICKQCGKPRVKIIKATGGNIGKFTNKGDTLVQGTRAIQAGDCKRMDSGDGSYKRTVQGWTDCGCKAGHERGIVLDPFFGSGTTGMVAQKLGRDWVGIEINPEYIKLSKKRFDQKQKRLF